MRKFLKELSKKAYNGERCLEEVLDFLLDKEQHKLIKAAIDLKMPFMIFDDADCGDGLLYRALKNEGVTVVKNFQIDQESQKENAAENSVYFTVYLRKPITEEW